MVRLKGYPDKCENYKGKKGNMETIYSNWDGGRKHSIKHSIFEGCLCGSILAVFSPFISS